MPGALSTSAPASPPKLPALSSALSLVLESIDHRTQLATLELGDARDHLLGSTLLASAAGAMGLFTGLALTLLITGLVWDSPHRNWWLGGLCAIYLGAALSAGFVLTRRLRQWRPLGEIQSQLRQDCQCLSVLIKSIGR